MADLEKLLEDWATTAEAVRNSENPELLLGPVNESDFVRVDRPQ